MTNSSLATSDLRELADAELDDVNGGLIAWIAYCAGIGVCLGWLLGYSDVGGGGGAHSAPGDYEPGPKNTA